MGAHNFGYFFREGLSNLFRHGFMSFASVGVTVACLLLTGTFALAALNVRDNLEGLEEENEILAFVDESYTEKQARALEARLLAVPNVAAARFISRGEALDRFVREHPEEDLFQDLEPQDFRDRYSLRLDNLERLSETVEQIQQVPGVDGVNYYEEFAGGVVAMRNNHLVISVNQPRQNSFRQSQLFKRNIYISAIPANFDFKEPNFSACKFVNVECRRRHEDSINFVRGYHFGVEH